MHMATDDYYTISTLEEFDERKVVGRGAYGAVYEVRMNGTPCIAKRVHDILVGQRGYAQVGPDDIEAVRSRFQAECILLSKLKHPNIVQFLGVYRDKDDDVLVMEYMPMDLAKCLDTCTGQQFIMPLPIKLSILQDVTNGLLHLHSLGPPIIHRDLTASNILLTSDMRAKIADLGVSKVFDLQQVQTIQQTKAPGTPAYMPPEALIPKPQYGVQLDIFSFGVLSLYTANQEFPAPHEVAPTQIILEQKKIQIFKRHHWIDKMGVDHPLCPIVVQCLQDLPGARPNSRKLWEDMSSLCTKHKKDWNNLLKLIKENEELKAQKVEIELKNKNEKETLEKEQVEYLAKVKSLNKELTELKVQHEIIQVALKGSDTERALVERKLKQDMSTVALQNKKLQENYKKVCVELVDVTEKNKSLEEHIGVLQTQVDVYKSDFANERSDRERMADEIEKKSATANATSQGQSNVVVVSYKSEDDDFKQKQLDSLQEVYEVARRKISDHENEISDLKEQIQTFISKEEASKRSLEEAIATSSKLNEEVIVLTQQVKQYKKQADNLRSQVEKYEQMNKSRVEQADPARFVPQSQAGEPDANYHHQMKQSAQQAYQMHQVRQPHHEDAYAHHLMGEVTPAAGFPLRASPSDNAYPHSYAYQPPQGYAYQPPQLYAYQPPQGLAPTPGQGLVPSPPLRHHLKQGALHDEDDDLPPPILTPFQQLPNSQTRPPVSVQAASEQPLNAPYQHYHQPQSQPPVRYPHTTMPPGPQRYDDPHYQQEWQHAADAQGYAQPRVGLGAPQPHWPVQNSPHVMPDGNDPHLVQDVELAKGIGSDISSAMVKLQAGKDTNGSSSREAPPDPNLVCPVCRNAFRKGEIQKYRRHVETCGKKYS